MSRLLLVRHGRASAAWDADRDPGLDDVGRGQADAMAAAVAPAGPMPLFTSPLRRCRETASHLAGVWGAGAVVEPGVGEVVAPTAELAGRGEWLRVFMSATWDDQPAALLAWRQRVVDTLLGLSGTDAVVVTHFIAINAAVGEATGNRRVVSFAPDNCSRTEIEVEQGTLRLVRLGGQARTAVQ